MSMSHGGHAGHMPAGGDRKALVISGWLTGVYFVIELGIGLWTGSVAVTSDAFHTFSAVGGVLIALVALWLLYERQKADLNLRGAYWHILQTFVGSFLIIVSALVIRFTGFLAIDPLLGMAFGVVLLWASWGITKDALHMGFSRDTRKNAPQNSNNSFGAMT